MVSPEELVDCEIDRMTCEEGIVRAEELIEVLEELGMEDSIVVEEILNKLEKLEKKINKKLDI
jgi:hypothetical protein